MQTSMRLGFVGTGAITSAIVTGLKKVDADRYSIRLSPRNAEAAERLASRFPGVSVAASNQDVLDGCDTVLLAVRPQVAREVLSALHFRADHHVISLVAALPMRILETLVAPATKISRAIPLPATAKLRGPTVIYPPDPVSAELFAPLGAAIQVESETEFSGCSTATSTLAAYFAYAGTVTRWLAGQGMPPAKAREYMARIYWGLASTALDEPELTFETLARDHATPGGINEQVMRHLTEHQVFECLSEALDAAMRRVMAASEKF